MNRLDNVEYFFGSIMLLANKFQIWGDGILDDITMKQWFLLALIVQMDKENPTVTETADFTGTTRQNIKKQLSQLETKGYVNLTRSKTDARALCVGLTKKAGDYFSSHEKLCSDAIKGLFSKINDNELETAIQVTNKLLSFYSHDILKGIGK